MFFVSSQPQYRQKDTTHKFIRKLMALCFLPADHIQPVFQKLQDSVDSLKAPQISQLLQYISSTWLHSSVWPTQSWSVYMRSTRTNNDVEGWHNRLVDFFTSRFAFYYDFPVYTLKIYHDKKKYQHYL